MDQAFKNAIARRDELREEIESLQEKVAPLQRRIDALVIEQTEVQTFLDQYERFARVAPAEKPDDVQRPAQSNAKSRRKQPVTPSELAKISRAILEEKGRPLTRGELAAELEARGVYLHGTNDPEKAKYVGTILWRKPEEFVNIDGRGYWPKSLPVPPVPVFGAAVDKTLGLRQ